MFNLKDINNDIRLFADDTSLFVVVENDHAAAATSLTEDLNVIYFINFISIFLRIKLDCPFLSLVGNNIQVFSQRGCCCSMVIFYHYK
jgi:hypothetical protein